MFWTNYDHISGVTESFSAGMRICPNMECNALVLHATGPETNRQTFPPEVIEFDPKDLPKKILSIFEEAVVCHSVGSFRASSLMVRRTLEEVCKDKGATGKDLKDRIAALGKFAILPNELLEAADHLRLLGNDAAHVEAKNYDGVGKEESEIAIELTKEILKAVYQFGSLVSRLTALKKP